VKLCEGKTLKLSIKHEILEFWSRDWVNTYRKTHERHVFTCFGSCI